MKINLGSKHLVQSLWRWLEWITSWPADKLRVDARMHTQADAVNDNTQRPKLAWGYKNDVKRQNTIASLDQYIAPIVSDQMGQMG